MDNRPIVAIVGRPNVGKSTLFNKLTGTKISIVEDTPGVTRDRIFGEVEWLNKYFTIIDTGGIEPESDDIIISQMRNQAMLAVDMAHVILFVVDGKGGLTAADREVADILRKTNKPVLLVVNKIDSKSQWDNVYDFYELGLDMPFAVSGANAIGLGDLLDEIVKNFPDGLNTEYDEDVIKVAITGKPNAGKSSILNNILGEERVIVSPIAGTTRDAIDTYFEQGDNKFLLIDTAGIRRRSKVYENVERFSVIRSMSAVDRADVVLIVIDATEGVTEQDTKIAGIAHDEGKACIFVVNKWDLVEKDNKTMGNYKMSIREKFPFMAYAPIVFVSAVTNQRIAKILETVVYVSSEQNKRVSTSVLNQVIAEAVMLNQPPSDKGRRLKIYYGTQTGVKPPTFTLFINDKELTHFSYTRYIENRMRENFGYEGTSIRIDYKQKRR
ncbi:MAG: ribosome biogenesis GTPase Der [Peptostreptococcus sp.]|jgi:GTP-binding protein|uniref:ribosome biogenesis GTPase Der n=1 Tax=Peptostreptococcus TaxID=1257 RepID=UPI000767BF3D|nr:MULTISPECIES: ribosome biogenesis GTPase Der [Peptostreptococcus]KXB72650.1 ribosome biogenesis GTPase Der [Peptostreptococcus anaerobius]MCB6982031.1 ribosome biogenesis GTPase Der [Peptostreptococcus anaerobius]MCQ5149972.1 ribosome biogenesis GTPase Der [Peptostreptococcus anaerobius]MDB8849372.1 ribosome biogenesis GTPase Der [Peptostreptococcus anaerobius]MDB8853073.1 ribosome biogenesis GTPase Der [Peptostreptococcus anaerobius]